MFSIFKKKYYLGEHLEGFTDIHCHVLPGIDDGAKAVKDAISMLKKYSQMGIYNIIATPHIMKDYYENTPQSIEKSFKRLESVLTPARLTHLKINAAAEHMIDSNFETILEKNTVMPLAKKYLLVELSYLQPPINLFSILQQIRESGFWPVLAHPERYSYYYNTPDMYKTLKQMGCFFQLNLLSLSEYYGKSVQKTAVTLLENNLIDFVGTDAHNLYQLEKIEQLQITKKNIALLKSIIENTSDVFDAKKV